jgi:nitroreductase
VIAIGMKRQEIEKIPEIEEVEAVACAVHNMHLTASALGVAAFWSTPPIVYSAGMKSFLGLGPRDACLGLFYLGWPQEGLAWPAGTRRPASEKITWRG